MVIHVAALAAGEMYGKEVAVPVPDSHEDRRRGHGRERRLPFEGGPACLAAIAASDPPGSVERARGTAWPKAMSRRR